MDLRFSERLTLWKVFDEIITHNEDLEIDEMVTLLQLWNEIKKTDEIEKTGKKCKFLKGCINFAREEMQLTTKEIVILENIERKL